jgi:hypothetical protein
MGSSASDALTKEVRMPITPNDRAIAKAFCDEIGCTTVHHLRDELPAFVARVRETEQARCLAIVETEEELTGEPSPVSLRLLETLPKLGFARLAVRNTKDAIAARIQGDNLPPKT